jgi:repressor LexA
MLNDRAREILAFVKRFSRDRGSPPTIREIGKEFGITSTNGVRYYLTMLEKAGYLSRRDRVSRGIKLSEASGAVHGIPILGRVAAGEPILAEESLDGRLEPDRFFGDLNGLFALEVRGDSMIDAGILEGDYVIVRRQQDAHSGDIVVALLEDEATVKYYKPRHGKVESVAANENYDPIVVQLGTPFQILGVVRGVMRTVGR